MGKIKKRIVIAISGLVLALGIGIFCNTQNVYAGTFDNAQTFYNTYGSQIVFKDGYFYFATYGKQASSQVSTTHWKTIGYRMYVGTSNYAEYIYYSFSGANVSEVSEVISGGYIYSLSRVSLASVKSKLASENYGCYSEFIINGGYIVVDSCMITVKIDSQGNRTNSGSMDDWGNFYGSVYTDYYGIAGAAPWSNPSSLWSYFNKSINYETELKLWQTVYVRYQKADGSYGDYSAVINGYYVYGETVSWSRAADDVYKKASISYTATSANTKYVDVERKTYLQRVYVSYMDSGGNYGEWQLAESKNVRYGASYSWSYSGSSAYDSASVSSYTVKKANDHYVYIARKSYTQRVYARYMDASGNYGEYQLVKTQSVRYGANFSWSYAGSDCYNSASVASYKVTGSKDNYVSISRKKYVVTLARGVGISNVSGAGTYYYGASCTVDATVKTGYTWQNWSGDKSSTSKNFTFTVKGAVSLTANARANVYYIEFHPNGGSGTMAKMTYYYDQTYTLPAMRFSYPERPCIYIGWNTNANSFDKEYSECQQIKNLTAVDGYTFHFYAIWDYAPELVTKTRYFTLYEAQTGVITQTELLRTASSVDREDGTTVITLSNYSASWFTSMTQDGFVEVEYTTTDSRGNVTTERAVVTVVDTTNTSSGDMDDDGSRRHARFISSRYWQKSYGLGGLESTSLWRNEVAYRNTLQSAMTNAENDGNSTYSVWIFTKEDIAEVKAYVSNNGLGNSKSESALSRFINNFIRCRQ